MLSEVRVFAPAKINLGLRVLPCRKDGFHGIESIFQTVGLKDELIVSPSAGYGKCRVFCDGFNLPEKNTITSAYNAFRDAAGIEPVSVDVKLIKNIPCGGGLGGGSSDAAFFVRALERIHDIGLSNEQLDSVAASVGSDVFFFFHCAESTGGAAVVSGRGEIVDVIPFRSDLHIALAFPGVHSSTKEAYSLVDKWFESGELLDYPDLNGLKAVYNSPVEDWSFRNSFTIPLTARYPEIGHALECVRRSGALYSEMSGSGSSVFGIYASSEDAQRAVNLMDCEGLNGAVACWNLIK